MLEAVEWLWAHRNDPDIIQSARNENKTQLVSLLSTGKSLGSGIASAADQMVEAITSVGTAVLEFLGGVTGIPLLRGLQQYQSGPGSLYRNPYLNWFVYRQPQHDPDGAGRLGLAETGRLLQRTHY